MSRPDSNTYPPIFHTYIKLVDEPDIGTALSNHSALAESFFKSIPEEKRQYRYGEDKWTIQEVLQHIIDAERIFLYRALAFARKDPNILPSFEETDYAAESNANKRKWDELVAEFSAVRKSTQFLFGSFSEEQLDLTGRASNYQMSVKAMGYAIAGHATHHIHIIKERYL
jgi:uncharacterized damage-inducible protein DinB